MTLSPVSLSPRFSTIDIGNMPACVADIQNASRTAPIVLTFDPYVRNYPRLLSDLQRAASFLPPEYQDAASTPFISYLSRLGEREFYQIFMGTITNPQQALLKEVIPDIALAILTCGDLNPSKQSSDAFQEVISDLYDGFLAGERRVNKQTGQVVKPPDLEVLAPLVKWGNPDAGPYTWPADITSMLGLKVAIVSLPPAFSQGGLLSWAALGHETAGHDVGHADNGLIEELQQRIYSAVLHTFGSPQLASYWASCADEAMADVCGCLHMGPAAAIGLIGFFRGLSRTGRLRSIGSMGDPHPIDILRGFMAAKVVGQSRFAQASAWSHIVQNESLADLSPIAFIDPQTRQYIPFPVDDSTAIKSARFVGDIIANSKLIALEGHSLRDIKDWTDADQAITNVLGAALGRGSGLPQTYRGDGLFAAHAVAAATLEGLKYGAPIQRIFNGMVNMLGEMHAGNSAWRSHSIYTRHRGSLRARPPFLHSSSLSQGSIRLRPQTQPMAQRFIPRPTIPPQRPSETLERTSWVPAAFYHSRIRNPRSFYA